MRAPLGSGRVFASMLGVLVAGAMPGHAFELPAGLEFQASPTTVNPFDPPSVGIDAAGNFVVVWTSQAYDYEIRGRRYDATGVAQGADFAVNSYTTGQQRRPVVATHPSGDFVVAWDSQGQDGSGFGVFARRFDGTATPQGAEFQVNTYTTGSQTVPAIAIDGSGNLVFAWQSAGQDGSNDGVVARRFDGSGSPLGPEIPVNTYTTGNQQAPSVAADPAGNFVVTWDSDGQDGSGVGVFARRFDGTGAPQGPEFQANTYTFANQNRPAATTDPAGNFVIAWISWPHQDGSGFGVFAQRYDASGAPQGGEFQVNTYTTGEQELPALATDAAGNFVVVWRGVEGGSPFDYGIFAQRYDGSGTPLGVEFHVNSTPASFVGPAVARRSGGDFVVVWSDGYQIRGQRYASTVPVKGARLAVRDDADPTRRQILFRSIDHQVSTSADVGMNPVANGAWLQVYNPGTGESVCLPLPAGGWSAQLDPSHAPNRLFVYLDRTFANGPCLTAQVRHASRLKVVCKASVQPIGFSLDEPQQGSLVASLVSGGGRYCALFGGTIRTDSATARRFLAVGAPAPATCPPPPVSCP